MKGDLFRNKYRTQTVRLPGYNYGQPGYYFVTICTKDRVSYFGDVKNHKMVLSNIGKIAKQCWLEIPKHFPHVSLDEFVIMPNHVHGIVVINDDGDTQVEAQNFAPPRNTSPTHNFAPPQQGQPHKNKFGPQSKNLSSIIRGYKIGVKKWATINHVRFGWQPRFYESIVRNEKSLNNIRNYIRANPAKWWRDRNNSKELLN